MAYLLMALVGLIMLLLTVAAYERIDGLLARFTLAAAVILLADWVAFGWFRLYDYAPGILSVPIQDAALGEFLAELIFVPALALFLDRFLPGLNGAIAGGVLVTLIEFLMLRQQTFRQHGWSIWYTLIGFLVYFILLHEFWDAVRRGRVSHQVAMRLVRLCATFFAVGLLTLVLRAFRSVHTNLHLMPTELGNQSLGRFLTYALVTVPLGYWVASVRGPARWWRLAGAMAALAGFNLVMVAIHFQQFRPPYSLTLDALVQGGAILAAARFQDLIDPHSLISEPELHRL